MGCLKFLALPVGLIAILLFWLNEPLPPNTANPVLYKTMAGLMKLNYKVAELQAWWTGQDVRVVEQNNIEKIALASRKSDPDVAASEETFAGVKVFVYQPKTKKRGRPALIYFHGGGFITGHPALYEQLFHKFVKQLDMVVVAVRYRLAPVVKAPSHHEDCEKAVQHFFINAEKYGVNPDLVGVAGDSAGGNLAATTSLKLRDLGESQFIFQMLIYPYVQGLDLRTPSYQRNCPTAISFMTYEAMSSYLGSLIGLPPRVFPELLENRHVKPEIWDKYKKYFTLNEIPKESIPPNYKPVRPSKFNKALAEFAEADLTNPYLFPLLADDLSNLPPAYVLTVENDPIMDEGIWYSNRLVKAGNKVVHDHSPDGFHGMTAMQDPTIGFDPAYKVADDMLKFAANVLRDVKKRLEEKPPAAKIVKEVKIEEKVAEQEVKIEKQAMKEETVVEKEAKIQEKVEKEAIKVEKVGVPKVQNNKNDKKKEFPKAAEADLPSQPVKKTLDEQNTNGKKVDGKKLGGQETEAKEAEVKRTGAKKTEAKKAGGKKAETKKEETKETETKN